MGGSGGGYIPSSRSPNSEKVSEEVSIARANSMLSDALKVYNDRDISAISKSLKLLSDCLNAETEGRVDIRYGGSVSKHTYVDGISDIDTLVILNKSDYASLSPEEALDKFAERIRKRLPTCDVRVGSIAITINYKSGREIQLLPSIKDRNGHQKVKSWNDNKWIKTRGDLFAKKLRAINITTGGKAIPTIKLVKGILADGSSRTKLSGYHVEALAIEAFKNYNGKRDNLSMISHFISQSKERVMNTIKDKSGQSVNVDS